MMDFRPQTMVMVSRAEVFSARNCQRGVQNALDNGRLQLEWAPMIQQRPRTNDVIINSVELSSVPCPTCSISGCTDMAAIRGVMAPWSSLTLYEMRFSDFEQAVDC
jgi:hypothetical protein